MNALVHHGPKKGSVDTVPDAKLEKLTDVIIRLSIANISASDLHMYEGRTDVEKGKTLGHEHLSLSYNNLLRFPYLNGYSLKALRRLRLRGLRSLQHLRQAFDTAIWAGRSRSRAFLNKEQ
jgi:hypothetical protein